MPNNYEVQDLSEVAPHSFTMAGQTFRVPRRVPLEGLGLLAGVVVNDSGQKVYAAARIISTLIEMIADELFIDGEWRPVDDRTRFAALLASKRVNIPLETLGNLALDLVKELSGHPTGGPKL